MTASNLPPIRPKAAVSISTMARQISMSRSRFYDYVEQGVFPKPQRCPRTKRPFFDAAQQTEIISTRTTGMTPDGQYVLFYDARPRTSPTTPSPKSSSRISELVEGLKSLGLNPTAAQVQEAVEKCFPNGTAGTDEATVLRLVYRHLRSRGIG